MRQLCPIVRDSSPSGTVQGGKVAQCTDCDDLLRAAFATGPSIRVAHRRTRLRVRR